MKSHSLLRALTTGGALLALAAPAAAQSTTHPRAAATPVSSIGVVPPDLRNPDKREGHTSPRWLTANGDQAAAQAAHRPAPPPRIVTTSPAGFDWRSAAIGGGVFACLAALAWLAAAGLARRRRIPAAR
jgi:hypothetical protein